MSPFILVFPCQGREKVTSQDLIIFSFSQLNSLEKLETVISKLLCISYVIIVEAEYVAQLVE